ncbi:MAG: hypothetical protein U0L53_03195 [Bacteroidales bacterium]|nr:hypothetical protein [Bacteroidales bacterium]
MKKVLLFLILASMFNILQAQVFKEDNEYTRTTKVKISDDVMNNSSVLKILPVHEKVDIFLSEGTDGNAMFTRIEDKILEKAKHVVLNSYFSVRDFTIYKNNLYFCGNISVDSTTEAFVAYVDIDDLFSSTNSSTIKYTIINNIYQDKVYSIDRIEVFTDSNDVVLAGIGKMYYGKPKYLKFFYDPIVGSYTDYFDPDEYYLDFFMLYTIKETQEITNNYDAALGATPVYDTANHVELFYVPTDTVGSCYYNKFADITQTEDKIYLTVVNHSNPSVDFDSHAKYIDVISFDKLTRQQQKGRVVLPFEIHPEFGVKTTALKNDDIAIACMKCNEQTSKTECCALKIEPLDTTSFILSNISIFDSVFGKPHILDCEYLDTTNELIVLKEILKNDNYEEWIYHISMNETLNFPYISNKYEINTDIPSERLPWNDLQSSDPYNYTVFGGFKNNLLVYDRKFDAFSVPSNCFTMQKVKVETVEKIEITNIPALEQCRFTIETPTIINGNQLSHIYTSTPIHKVFVESFSIPPFSIPIIIKECTN